MRSLPPVARVFRRARRGTKPDVTSVGVRVDTEKSSADVGMSQILTVMSPLALHSYGRVRLKAAARRVSGAREKKKTSAARAPSEL